MNAETCYRLIALVPHINIGCIASHSPVSRCRESATHYLQQS